MKITINDANPNKLHDELIAVGLVPLLVEHDRLEGENIAQKTWITFLGDVDMELVQQIIDAHDPTPLPPQSTEKELMNDYIIDMDFRLSMIELGF